MYMYMNTFSPHTFIYTQTCTPTHKRKTNHTLKLFNIKDCDIDSIGAHHIADGLNCNRTLKKLNINYNSIGDVGAMALAQMLRINKARIHNMYMYMFECVR